MIDPKDRVTETAFNIAPHLIGARLATPKRRAAALAVDLILVAIVAGLGLGGVVSAIIGILFFRFIMRRSKGGAVDKAGRAIVAVIGGFIIFGLSFAVLGGGGEDDDDDDDVGDVVASVEGLSAEDSTEVAEALEVADDALEMAGLDLESMMGMARLNDFRSAARSEEMSDSERSDMLGTLMGYTNAFAVQDTMTMDSLHGDVQAFVAGEELDRRAERIDRLDDEVDDLEDEVEELEETIDNPSFIRMVRSAATDFGLRFGWMGVYFTLMLAGFRGYTPGKRLFGIRVFKLDGKPLNLWLSFERFGGYAAGVATGLLGFFQVYWDPNRQGVHDKIAGTVVVRMLDAETMSMTPIEERGPDLPTADDSE